MIIDGLMNNKPVHEAYAEMEIRKINKKAQLSLAKMRYSVYSFCCSTDLEGYKRSMIFT